MEKQKVFIPVEKLIEEIKRVKKQRNNYEQELMIANRRLLKMKVELEIEREKRLEKQKPINEDELIEKFKPYVNEWEDTPSESLSNRLAIRLAGSDLIKAKQCAQIVKQYSDSKLSELEKWIDTYTEFFEFSSSQLKDKIKSLKQQS